MMPSAKIAQRKSAAVAVLAAMLAWGASATPALAGESSDATTVGAASAPTQGASEATEAPSPTTPSPGQSGEATTDAEQAELDGVALATWYGPGLFGRHTACGQVLTKRTVGVANKTLPCGTLVEMRYRGRHVTVPVVDRGPYDGPLGASWDLTEGAAKLLHMTESARVTAKIVGHTQNTPDLGLESATSSRVAQAKSSGTTGGTSSTA